MNSMKLTSAEAKQEVAYDSDPKAPEYPYGLTICLDDESLSKLGLKSLPDVGVVMYLEAKVKVCSKSQYDNQEGATSNLSLQITDMELTETDDDVPKDTRTAAQKVYGKK